jgi:hypothetical protein
MDGPPEQEGIQQLEELIRTVDDLRRRVASLEERSAGSLLAAELPAPIVEPLPLPEVSSGLLAQLGRLLLGIAGAYLLRAITEAGILPELTGTIVGLVYAGAWLVASIRTAASNRVSLALEGLTASAIAGPLLWEATTRFHAIAPSGAAAALACFIVLGQIVAWKHDHSAIAAITALAGSVTAVALIVATLDPVPFAIALLSAAAVVEYGAIRDYAIRWRWIIALAADFSAFLLVYLVTRPQGPPEGYASISIAAVAAVQLLLVAVYLSSTAARTLIRRRRIEWFEILQVAALAGFTIASNLRMTHTVGEAMIVAGAACYVAAFMGAARWIDRNFHVYATFGLILSLAGSFLLFDGLTIVALWSTLAVAAIWFGERQDKNTLRTHSAVYLLGVAAASVKLEHYWPTALAAGLVYGVMLRIGSARKKPITERIPAALVAGLLAASLYSLPAASLIRIRIDASYASTIRTMIISMIALAVGWCGKRWNRTELIWILYPSMIFGGVKLLAEDFQQGRPAALFLSLLVYGGTLIALPRLLKRTDYRRIDLSYKEDQS